MTSSHDALEVAEVLSNKLRPIWVFVAGVIAIGGAGVTKIWQLSEFIHKDASHERQQDDVLLQLKALITKNEGGFRECKGQNLKTVELIITDLDLLRSRVVHLLPPRKREQARRDFAAQQKKGLDLLVGAQR